MYTAVLCGGKQKVLMKVQFGLSCPYFMSSLCNVIRAASLLLADRDGQLRRWSSLCCKVSSAELLMASNKLSLALILCKAINTADMTPASWLASSTTSH